MKGNRGNSRIGNLIAIPRGLHGRYRETMADLELSIASGGDGPVKDVSMAGMSNGACDMGVMPMSDMIGAAGDLPKFVADSQRRSYETLMQSSRPHAAPIATGASGMGSPNTSGPTGSPRSGSRRGAPGGSPRARGARGTRGRRRGRHRVTPSRPTASRYPSTRYTWRTASPARSWTRSRRRGARARGNLRRGSARR